MQFVLRRLATLLLTAVTTSIVVFSLLHLAPGSAISAIVPPGMHAQYREALVRKYGLDRPIAIQYLRWFGSIVRGDLGRSIVTNESVAALIYARSSNSLQLAALAVAISVVLGILAGALAAMRRGSLFDVLSMIVAIVSFSTPSFWLAILLILVFSVHFHWLPAGGAGSLKHLVLPALSLGASTAALVARMTRSAMLEVLPAPYVTTARAKGLAATTVVHRHILRNSLIPVVTSIGHTLGLVLSGAIVTETMFNFPGLGFTLVKSILQRDYPMIQGALLVASFAFLLTNMLVDLLYLYLDPRIRFN